MSDFDFDASIIIVNYRTHQLVADCLESIKKTADGFSYEIIVVDNSEDSDELEELLSLKKLYKHLNVIDAKRNLGFGKANNLGAKSAKGKYLLFLNSDTILINNAVFEMLAVFNQEKNVGAVGANLYRKDGKPAHSYIKCKMDIKGLKKTNSFFALLGRKFGRFDQFNKSRKLLEIKGYITGACIMVPETIFWQIGGFDEEIFMYGEDALLCAEIDKAGYRLLNTPKAKVVHLEGGSDERVFSDIKIKNFVEGIRIYAEKTFGKEEAQNYLKEEAKIYKKAAFRNKLLRHKVKVLNNCRIAAEFSGRSS